MDGVGWRGWALAFAAAILAHAGIVLFLLRQEPEPGIRPDAERVAAILLGRVDATAGDFSADVAESIDAELVTTVEGAREVPPGEAPPTPPETVIIATWSLADSIPMTQLELGKRAIQDLLANGRSV